MNMRHVFWIALFCATAGVRSRPPESIVPVSYPTIQVSTRECELPPIAVDLESEARQHRCYPHADPVITSRTACRMLTALREWMDGVPFAPPRMMPGDSQRIGAIRVCRQPPNMALGGLVLLADVPDRPRVFVVQMEEAGGRMQFFLDHRALSFFQDLPY